MFRLNRKLTDLFEKVRDNAVMLFVSLLLAFIMWGFACLTQQYSRSFNFRLDITSDIQGHSRNGDSVNPVLLSLNSTGSKLLERAFYNTSSTNSLSFHLGCNYLHKSRKDPELFWVTSRAIADQIKNSLEAGEELAGVDTDTIYFRFPLEINKKVPVIANLSLTFKEQYSSNKGLLLKPDSVIVYGDSSSIAGIKEVHTEPLRFHNISSDIQGLVNVAELPGITYSSNSIAYSMDVFRYYEAELDIFIQPLHFPSDKYTSFKPHRVHVKYRMPYHFRSALNAGDFHAYVDYHNLVDDNSGRVVVKCDNSNAFDIKADPQFVEFSLNNRVKALR